MKATATLIKGKTFPWSVFQMKIILTHVNQRSYFMQWIMARGTFWGVITIGAQWKFDRSIWYPFLDMYFPKKSNFVMLHEDQYLAEFPLFIMPITKICAKNIHMSSPVMFFHLLILAKVFSGLWQSEKNYYYLFYKPSVPPKKLLSIPQFSAEVTSVNNQQQKKKKDAISVFCTKLLV